VGHFLNNLLSFFFGNYPFGRWVAVGNEPFLTSYNGIYEDVALPALQNVQAALANAGHGNDIKATIPCNADVISTSPPYLPSQATWRADIATLMVQILQFLNNTGAPFMVNLYPFLSLVLTPDFPLPYAFFNSTSNSIVDGTHVYTNVFDASYDGLVTALTTAGFPSLPIIVGEIGWPTDGFPSANIQFAQSFMSQLVNHMLSGTGTPLRPGVLQGYLFSLLDEDAKSIAPGAFERHWGIFNYDGSIKYTLDLSGILHILCTKFWHVFKLGISLSIHSLQTRSSNNFVFTLSCRILMSQQKLQSIRSRGFPLARIIIFKL